MKKDTNISVLFSVCRLSLRYFAVFFRLLPYGHCPLGQVLFRSNHKPIPVITGTKQGAESSLLPLPNVNRGTEPLEKALFFQRPPPMFNT